MRSIASVSSAMLRKRVLRNSPKKKPWLSNRMAAETIRSRRTPAASLAVTVARAASRWMVVLPGPGGPSAEKTASWPERAACNSVALRGSPSRTVNLSREAPSFCGERTNAVTVWPRSSDWVRSCRPIPPVAPRTKSRMSMPPSDSADSSDVDRAPAGETAPPESFRWRSENVEPAQESPGEEEVHVGIGDVAERRLLRELLGEEDRRARPEVGGDAELWVHPVIHSDLQAGDVEAVPRVGTRGLADPVGAPSRAEADPGIPLLIRQEVVIGLHARRGAIDVAVAGDEVAGAELPTAAVDPDQPVGVDAVTDIELDLPASVRQIGERRGIAADVSDALAVPGAQTELPGARRRVDAAADRRRAHSGGGVGLHESRFQDSHVALLRQRRHGGGRGDGNEENASLHGCSFVFSGFADWTLCHAARGPIAKCVFRPTKEVRLFKVPTGCGIFRHLGSRKLRWRIRSAARESILLQAVDERAAAEPQPPRGLGLVARNRRERPRDHAALEGFHLLAQTERS